MFRGMNLRRSLPGLLTALLFAANLLPRVVLANVYATQVRLNDSTDPIAAPGIGTVKISYLLNEPASGGVQLRVSSGTNTVHTIDVKPGTPGALKGTNLITWDGQLDGSRPLRPGVYRISLTASNTGHADWTQLTSDADIRTYVWEGRGVAVNPNPDSPFFGRIFIANAGRGPGLYPGDDVGILKFNADFTDAADGGFSTGGYNWAGDLHSPWKIEVSRDDGVYVNDFTSHGEFHRFDQSISPASHLQITSAANAGETGAARLGGFALSGIGRDTALVVGDQRATNTPGILRFALGITGVAATNDTGTIMIGSGGSLSGIPGDVALDKAGNAYVIQSPMDPLNPQPVILKFPPWDPSTNNGTPILQADWAVGGTEPHFGNPSGIAISPDGNFLAVSFLGTTPLAGNTSVFYTSNGAPVASLDLGQSISGQSSHEDTDCAWDAAGNLYYIDNHYGAWRAVSPPGPNGFTTPSIAFIQITGPLNITGIGLSNTTVTILFDGAETEDPSAFEIHSSGDPMTGYTLEAAAVISQTGPGHFQATIPQTGAQKFYRLKRPAAAL